MKNIREGLTEHGIRQALSLIIPAGPRDEVCRQSRPGARRREQGEPPPLPDYDRPPGKGYPIGHLIMGIDLIIGRGHAAEFAEYPVKLGEAGKTGNLRNLGDFLVRVQQKVLGILDAGELDVLYHRIAGNLLEPMREVIGADVKAVGQGSKGDILVIMCVDIIGYGIHLVLNSVFDTGRIVVMFFHAVQQEQKFRKFAVNHQIADAGVVNRIVDFHDFVQLLK